MVVKPVVLLGAAVHTRNNKPGQDYDWFIKVGDMQLFENMDKIYRVALRDIGGEVPRLAVLIDGQRVGFLMGELPSPRMDHSNRVIYDTLYLEFDTQYQRSVLHAAAVLLLCSKNTYKPHEQHFTDYAEMLFQTAPGTHLPPIKLPVVHKQPNFNLEPINTKKLALFSNPENRNRCARYLINFDYKNNNTNNTFSFVSTGRVSLEKCQQIADLNDECVLLTLSSEVQSEQNLKKGQLSRFKRILKLT
ncbi:MAG: hypothetical protein DRR19_01575 [Candidatus Parabeggiatoa sp. nov. 1]|nr:MAG: hypothetical protein DRR19_01575 [Gammaproteobacteria bacterium]